MAIEVLPSPPQTMVWLHGWSQFGVRGGKRKSTLMAWALFMYMGLLKEFGEADKSTFIALGGGGMTSVATPEIYWGGDLSSPPQLVA